MSELATERRDFRNHIFRFSRVLFQISVNWIIDRR